jgi:uncharacterized protein
LRVYHRFLGLVLAALICAPGPVSYAQTATTSNQPAATVPALPFPKLLKLAKVGDEDAQMAVALAYEAGSNVPQNLTEAAKWYRQAALTGNLNAQFRLAGIVSKGAKGLTQDLPTAVKLYQAGAEKGHAESQNMLGQLYQNGSGLPKDLEKAYAWYQKAADARLPVAENNLGILYLNGLGVSRSLDEAFKLFDRAAQQGDGWGLNNLGGMYEMGWGTAANKSKAKELYAKALAAGILAAQKNLERVSASAALNQTNN